MNYDRTETASVRSTPLRQIESLDGEAHEITDRMLQKLQQVADNMLGPEPSTPVDSAKGNLKGIGIGPGWFSTRIDHKSTLVAKLVDLERQVDRLTREVNQ